MLVLRCAASSYITEEFLQEEQQMIEQLGLKYRAECSGKLSPESLQKSDLLIINSQYKIDKSFLDSWQGGKLIITTSSGYDHIAVTDCISRGITVARTPSARTEQVAEHSLGMILALLRDLHRTGRELHNGLWNRAQAAQNCRCLEKETIGVIGYGRIGRRLCEKLSCFSRGQLLVNDPLKEKQIETDGYGKAERLKTVLKNATVLTIHTDLNRTTQGMFSSKLFDLMRDQALLVNTARGSIIDEAALINALERGDLAGAAVDVFNQEPLTNNDLLTAPSLLLTPHAAGFGPEMLKQLQKEIIRTIKNFINNTPLPATLPTRTTSDYQKLRQEQENLK